MTDQIAHIPRTEEWVVQEALGLASLNPHRGFESIIIALCDLLADPLVAEMRHRPAYQRAIEALRRVWG